MDRLVYVRPMVYVGLLPHYDDRLDMAQLRRLCHDMT